MTRPIYETSRHLSAEQKIAEVICNRFNCTFQKVPIKYGLDYAALRQGKICAFFELKCRTNPMRQYPDYMLSMHKLMAAQRINLTTALPCFLAVSWTDAIGYAELIPDCYDYGISGRKDRNDPDDIEPVGYIPIDQFRIIHRY